MLEIIKITVIVLTGIYISYTDIKEKKIKNEVNLLLFIFGLIVCYVDYVNIESYIKGSLIIGSTFLILSLITNQIGMGDVKYIYAIGLIIGFNDTLIAITLAFIIASFVMIISRLFKNISIANRIVFGPYLVIGTIISFLIR